MTLPPTSGHVLVVEDDERLASLLCEYLREHNLSVDLVDHAEAVYQAVAVRGPDVVLLDWMLPGTEDGIAICRKLRASYRGAIIMLTARRTDADQVHGLEVGAETTQDSLPGGGQPFPGGVDYPLGFVRGFRLTLPWSSSSPKLPWRTQVLLFP